MKGDVIHSDVHRHDDPLTGVRITRLSDSQGNTNHPYFTASQVDDENTFVLVTSERTGQPQLYTLGLDDGTMVQLTDEGAITGGCLDARNRRVYYFGGRTLKLLQHALDPFLPLLIIQCSIALGKQAGELRVGWRKVAQQPVKTSHYRLITVAFCPLQFQNLPQPVNR